MMNKKYRFTPYSYSKINVLYNCPKKFEYKYIQRVPLKDRMPLKFFEKGHYYHHILSYFPYKPETSFKFELSSKEDIKNYQSVLSDVLKNNNYLKKLLKEYDSQRELEIYLDENYNTIPDRNNAFLLGFIDFLTRIDQDKVLIVDWKSGKVHNHDLDQMKFYAFLVMNLYQKEETPPKEYHTQFYFVEHGKTIDAIFHIDQYEDIKLYFEERINTIEQKTEYKRNPGRGCHYCEFFDICDPFNIKNFKQ